ncbi:MAG: SRPBCC family protein [Acidimicrobiia bacterium]
MRDSVTLRIDAPPAKVWELVSDVTHIGRFSPETFEAEWLDDATGPAEGVRFRGHVRRNGRGPVYWTTCTIVRCETEREFAFVVGKPGKHLMTWGYRLAPAEADDGSPATDVTEFYESADSKAMDLYWKLFKGRRRTNAEGMRTTLERLKVAAET